MNKYYEVLVTMTSKAIGDKSPNGEGYTIFHQEKKQFGTINEVKKWLKDTYGNSKREKMYVGEGKHTGYIYRFKNDDISHPWNDDGSKNEWYQMDWVNINEIKSKIIIIK